jgi:hypothetical protein
MDIRLAVQFRAAKKQVRAHVCDFLGVPVFVVGLMTWLQASHYSYQ